MTLHCLVWGQWGWGQRGRHTNGFRQWTDRLVNHVDTIIMCNPTVHAYNYGLRFRLMNGTSGSVKHMEPITNAVYTMWAPEIVRLFLQLQYTTVCNMYQLSSVSFLVFFCFLPPSQFLRDMIRLIRECWYFDPSARPSAFYLKKKLLRMAQEENKLNYSEQR